MTEKSEVSSLKRPDLLSFSHSSAVKYRILKGRCADVMWHTISRMPFFIMYTQKLQPIAKMLCVRSNKSGRVSVYAEILSKGLTWDMFKHEKDCQSCPHTYCVFWYLFSSSPTTDAIKFHHQYPFFKMAQRNKLLRLSEIIYYCIMVCVYSLNPILVTNNYQKWAKSDNISLF